MISRTRRILSLLGPAFVAAVAYVDPGNFAANFSAGSQYGYALLWVLVVANATAMLVQYLSAKVGLVTGKSLPEVIAEKLGQKSRIAYWLQAEVVAIATDIAEVIGGALGLYILFNIPLLLGAIITGTISMLLLLLYRKDDTKVFERVIMGLLLIIPIGFFVGLAAKPPEPVAMLAGLLPMLQNTDMVLLAVAMLGATVMPHVVYLHSALSRDHYHGKVAKKSMAEALRATKIDVGLAMMFAGTVNIAMLLLAASALSGHSAANDLTSIFSALEHNVGVLVAWLFGLSLLVSGFASTAVGAQAGAVIMKDMIGYRLPIAARRLITIIPAIIIVALGVDPTVALIISQVALSFGIPFALIPLALVTANKLIMGSHTNRSGVTYAIWCIAALVSLLNAALIWLTIVS